MDKEKILDKYFEEFDNGEQFDCVYSSGNENFENKHYYFEYGGQVIKFENNYIASKGQIGNGFTDFCEYEIFDNKEDAIAWVKFYERKI